MKALTVLLVSAAALLLGAHVAEACCCYTKDAAINGFNIGFLTFKEGAYPPGLTKGTYDESGDPTTPCDVKGNMANGYKYNGDKADAKCVWPGFDKPPLNAANQPCDGDAAPRGSADNAYVCGISGVAKKPVPGKNNQRKRLLSVLGDRFKRSELSM